MPRASISSRRGGGSLASRTSGRGEPAVSQTCLPSSRWLAPGLCEAGATHRRLRPPGWGLSRIEEPERLRPGGRAPGARWGSPCPGADGEVSKIPLSPGGWRGEDAAEVGLEAPRAAGWTGRDAGSPEFVGARPRRALKSGAHVCASACAESAPTSPPDSPPSARLRRLGGGPQRVHTPPRLLRVGNSGTLQGLIHPWFNPPPSVSVLRLLAGPGAEGNQGPSCSDPLTPQLPDPGITYPDVLPEWAAGLWGRNKGRLDGVWGGREDSLPSIWRCNVQAGGSAAPTKVNRKYWPGAPLWPQRAFLGRFAHVGRA